MTEYRPNVYIYTRNWLFGMRQYLKHGIRWHKLGTRRNGMVYVKLSKGKVKRKGEMVFRDEVIGLKGKT